MFLDCTDSADRGASDPLPDPEVGRRCSGPGLTITSRNEQPVCEGF